MKITRFVHSCVLVEDGGHAVLIDPGNFSWSSGLVDLSKFPALDAIVITHEHGDHLDADFVKAALKHSPKAAIITTEGAMTQLEAAGVKSEGGQASEFVDVFITRHELLPVGMGEAPANIGVHVFGKLTHPGDSLSFTETRDILCMPFVSPWGSMTAASELAVKLKPKHIIPIHDAIWDGNSRGYFYSILKDGLATENIDLIIPTDGQSFET